jgi:hypothetical protein
MDLEEARRNLPVFREKTGLDPLPVSAEQKSGVDALRDALYERFFPAGPAA